MAGLVPNESENSRYYEILGVSEDASLDDLKKAYKKEALKHHPDKGGDPEKFIELDKAYRLLVAQKEGVGGIGNADLFSRPYRGGSRGGQQLRRGQDAVHSLKVSLEDLYGGTTKTVYLWRKVICPNCTGNMKCAGCQGTGMKVVYISHPSPSMIQRMQRLCDACKGTGETICPQCKGDKVVQEVKPLEVKVAKGMQNNQKITLPGQADEAPDTLPGDLVFFIQQEEHPIFKRIGDDLHIEQTVSLAEALCGCRFERSHLDGRPINFGFDRGEVVKPDSYKVIDNEGMPLYQSSSMKGKLVIHFKVLFPDSLDIDQTNALKAVLLLQTPSAMELVIDNEGMPLHQRPSTEGKLIIRLKVVFPDFLDIDQVKALEAVLLPQTPSPMELD